MFRQYRRYKVAKDQFGYVAVSIGLTALVTLLTHAHQDSWLFKEGGIRPEPKVLYNKVQFGEQPVMIVANHISETSN